MIHAFLMKLTPVPFLFATSRSLSSSHLFLICVAANDDGLVSCFNSRERERGKPGLMAGVVLVDEVGDVMVSSGEVAVDVGSGDRGRSSKGLANTRHTHEHHDPIHNTQRTSRPPTYAQDVTYALVVLLLMLHQQLQQH